MLLVNHKDGPVPKNLITISPLPNYIDKEQPPLKRQPFKTVAEHAFVYDLRILIPAGHELTGLEQLLEQDGTAHYCRVHMKLSEIVQGDFFNDYIKAGNILMLSEGRPGIDNVFTLRDGILRLDVNKPTFERLGLEGKPVPTEGRKHVKARYAIELNLRLPSMVRGKKGFDRVMWAFQNVLTDAKTWLFCNVRAPADFSGPISAFAPLARNVSPTISTMNDVEAPPFPGSDDLEDHESFADAFEWLSLVCLGSPRICSNDTVDPYLSRYKVPTTLQNGHEAASKTVSTVHRLGWHGLIHSNFINSLLVSLLKSYPSSKWLGVSAHTLDGNSYALLKTNKEVIVSRHSD